MVAQMSRSHGWRIWGKQERLVGCGLCIFQTGMKDSLCVSEEPRSCSTIEKVPAVVGIRRERDTLERCIVHLVGRRRKRWKAAILHRGELRKRLFLGQGRRMNPSRFLEKKKSTPVHIGRSCATNAAYHPGPGPSKFVASIPPQFGLRLVEITKVRNTLHKNMCEGDTIMA